jgi:septum site-determining protein MinD
LAVAGGKGGVGKSTVALNLGATWDAVVVDADLLMADLPTARGPDLHDVLAGRADPVEAVREGGAVDLLPCGRTLTGARACDPERLVGTLTEVARVYDRVVVDCPAGMAADAGLALLAADAYLLVTTPEPSAVAGALRTRSLARQLETGLCRVVLNRADERPPEGSMRQALGAPVVSVPADERLARAQAYGQPVSAVAPESTPAGRFRELASVVQSCRS